eukprot:gb/GFBE01078248.1/.p1 GENE.gb/GFBE01078248.1/~~gb/GFBE01078248.1/.p1  ORF type:complete len:430 (+),score=49.40 gb/GFBE01078248.1/:1-1290(+)
MSHLHQANVRRGTDGLVNAVTLEDRLLQHLSSGHVASAARLIDTHRHVATRSFFSSAITSCTTRKMHSSAVWLIQQMERFGYPISIAEFNHGLNSFMSMGNVEGAKSFWRCTVQDRLRPDGASFTIFIQGCSEAGIASDAEEFLLQMITEGALCKHFAYAAVINAFAKIPDVDSAQVWFDRAGAERVQDTHAYNAMISALAKAERSDEAESWFRRMREAGIRPDIKTFNILMHARAKLGHCQQAEFWMAEAVRANCKPNRISYCTLMDCCSKAGEMERTVHWLNKLGDQGFRPSLYCYNTILHACACNGDEESALHWFQLISAKGFQPNVISFNCMIRACVQAGRPQLALKWGQLLSRSGLHPDGVTESLLESARGALSDDKPPGEDRMKLAEGPATQGTLPSEDLIAHLQQLFGDKVVVAEDHVKIRL